MFLLLVLVHLRFFHSVSCGWLPFWGSPAGYSFPNGRPCGKRSSSSSRPGGRRRFIGVRGWAPPSGPSGFRRWGPSPFRRLSVPPLAGLEGQGCGDLGCRGAAAGLLSALPQHSSSSIVPIPMPSSSPISITGAALEEVTLGLIAKGALELAPLPSPGFYSHLFVVWKTSGSWRPVIDLSHLNRFVDVSHFQMETIQSVLSTSGGLDGLHQSQGSVSSGAGSSCFSSLSSLHVPWHGLPVQSSVLWPLHGSAGLHQGHGSCFSYTPFSGYPYASIPRRLAGPVFLSGVSPRGSADCPPTFSRIGDCHHPQKSTLIPSQVVQYLGVVIDSTSFRASPSVERISRLHSTAAEFQSCASPTASLWLSLLGGLSSLAHLVPGGRLRLRSLQLCLHRSWNRQVLEAPVLVSMECLHDLQWWLHLLRVSLRQVSPDLHFWSDASDVGWGAHLGCQVASGLWATQQAALSINAGNCSLFSWGFSSFGQLSKVARWLSFATTPQQWLTFARQVAPGLLSSTPWLRRSCAGWSPSPYAWLHSSFRAPTTS